MATNERWTGWIGFAGLLLVIIAMIDFFEGLIAIIRGQYYAITPNQIVVFDLKSPWGWITLIWAVLLGLTGSGAARRPSWARWMAIVLVSINVLTHFGFAGSAAYPLWALTVQILNLIVLYALTSTEPRANPRTSGALAPIRGQACASGPDPMGGFLGRTRDLADDLDNVVVARSRMRRWRSEQFPRPRIWWMPSSSGPTRARVRAVDLGERPPDELCDRHAVARAPLEIHHRRLEPVAASRLFWVIRIRWYDGISAPPA